MMESRPLRSSSYATHWKTRCRRGCTSYLLFAICCSLIPPRTLGFVSSVNYTRPGDIIIGGLFPLHTYDESSATCGTIRSINSLKKVEAMVYAVDRINQDEYLLPNITIGFEIYDTCGYDSKALQTSLNFIPSSIDGSRDDDKKPMLGVVGPQASSSSVLTSLLLGLYRIPMISYLSTSDELSNALRYPYFLRTVGSDRYQVRAIVDILLNYDWKYVSFVNSDDTYGTNALRRFVTLAANNDICIGWTQTVSGFDSDRDYDELVGSLLEAKDGYHHPSVVVMFVNRQKMVQNILSAVSRMNAEGRIIWIGSDSWGNNREAATVGHEEAALGQLIHSKKKTRRRKGSIFVL